MICPLAPLSGSTAEMEMSVVPRVAPSRMRSVKYVTPNGRKRGVLSLTSKTLTVSLAVEAKGEEKREKRERSEIEKGRKDGRKESPKKQA